MKCKENRTLDSLFHIFDCNNCKYNNKDECFIISNIFVNLYYNSFCNYIYNSEFIVKDLKEIIFLKDMIINKNNLFLWVFNYEINDDLLIHLSCFNLNLHIFIFYK